jgi:general secretion pathway protein D
MKFSVRKTARPWLRGGAQAIMTANVLVLAGCAGYQSFKEGQAHLAAGQTEQGLSKLHQAMEQDPANKDYRRTYYVQQESALNALLRDAELSLDGGAFAAARQAYQKAAKLDPLNSRASNGVARVDVADRLWKALDAAEALAREGKLEPAITKTQQVLSEDANLRRAKALLRQLMRQQADISGKELGIYPKLKAAYSVPVSLSFVNASLLQVFAALKQASGLNYMIERDVKPDLRVTIAVKDKPVQDIIRLLLATNQLESTVLDNDTLLIYPNTPAKAAEYREIVIRTFYISNAEATKVANLVRSIVKARDVAVDEKLNMVVVRDSAKVIRLAEKLIASLDLPDPEVMLELEVMEVNVNRLINLGLQWPGSVSASVVGAAGVNGQLTLNEFHTGNSGLVNLNFSNPLIAAQFNSTKGDANLLANPRVRIRNKQSAKILIGQRVPVITTTSTANVGTSDTVTYLDVGLKLDIEPSVSLDDEVSMKIALEVSNIVNTITLNNGTQVYTLGTRNTSTSLRVRDGETNILAGLIQRDERRSNTGIPGLNELPIVNRLFGANQDNDTRTEIVLLITPRIVRSLDVPGLGQQEFLSGTESSIGAAPIQLGATGAPDPRNSTGTQTPAGLNQAPGALINPLSNAPLIGPIQRPGLPGALPSTQGPGLSPTTAPAPVQTPAVTVPSLIPSSPVIQ